MAVRAVALREDLQVEADTGDVRPLLARAGCCVAPYPHGTAPGHWLLEALAMGAPVVATPEAIAGLEVTDGEELLIASDPDGFANDVRRLMRDIELREKISRNARRRVLAAFSWEVVGNQLIEAWRTAGARSRR
jgi:glycosyltransferase involved in cell wall biosynthesis